ncbi:MAG: exported protein of unknown function [Nitrosarchaeum sp.]|nr:exported protein of unknown function [Nitrosarchaeum sp.]
MIFLIAVFSIGVGHSFSAYGELSKCQPEMICVKKGDYLKYELDDGSELYYEFGKSIDKRIQYLEKGTDVNGTSYENKYILDKQTSEAFRLDDPKQIKSFVEMRIIPIIIDNSLMLDQRFHVSCNDILYKYNEIQRNSVSCKSEGERGHIELIYDKETGIRLLLDGDINDESNGINITRKWSSTLIDTNIILDKINAQETSNSKIPGWVKNIFEWYGQGQVSDDELLSAIKFLVQQRVIKLD